MKSSDVAAMSARERRALLEELSAMVTAGELTVGEVARILRSRVLGMDRIRFAKVVKVSPRAIAMLEDSPDANPTVETLSRVFAPFGGKLSLVFPRMSEPEPLSEDRARLRQSLRLALEQSRRKR